MKVVDLKALTKEHGLRGYSRLKKTGLIAFLRELLARPPEPQPVPAPCTRPPRPTRPPPPTPVTPRQPELRPYQLKPKRSKETFIEPPMKQELPPTSNLKQIKCMKKKLGKLNKKIKHSKKKHNNLVSKRNSIKKKIKELK